jgi:flavodoxin
MKTFAIVLVLTVVFLMAARMGNAAESKTGSKILIAYFSWGGNTRGIARQIHDQVGGDIFEIECVTPYSSNYNTCLEEAQRDQRQQARPALKTHAPDMAQYDVILLGYPNWWASIPMPIASFLEEYDFSGKKIVPFCSHGGGRLGQSVSAIAKLCPKSTILEALSVHYSGGNYLVSDIDAWLLKTGIGS